MMMILSAIERKKTKQNFKMKITKLQNFKITNKTKKLFAVINEKAVNVFSYHLLWM